MEDDLPAGAEEETQPTLEITTSRQFPSWLREQGVGLAFTTYQAGKLFMIGVRDDDRISAFERTFQRCMGLWADEDAMMLSTISQIWRFTNTLPPGKDYKGYHQLYVPRLSHTTGDLDIHDVAVDAGGRIVFANTRFSCLATVDPDNNFRPIWRPPFISRLAAEDRCHLNGIAMQAGWPKYVTAVSQSDVAEGWRDHRADGGVVVDVESNETVLDGLSMPHSPRLYRGRLWLLNSGTGELGFADIERGRFEPVAFCPGYARGLAFVDRFAVLSLSKPRRESSLVGLRLGEKLRSHDVEPRCGLMVVDLDSGDAVHWLKMEGVIQELYDVVVLPGATRPAVLGLKADEIHRVVSSGPDAPLRLEPMSTGETLH